jgi:carboxyl-terminal processing protease
VVEIRGGELRIRGVIEGGPAERAGLRRGDVIAGIDAAQTARMPLAEAVERLRGRAATQVTLDLVRGGEALTVRVAREVVRAAPPPVGTLARAAEIALRSESRA